MWTYELGPFVNTNPFESSEFINYFERLKTEKSNRDILSNFVKQRAYMDKDNSYTKFIVYIYGHNKLNYYDMIDKIYPQDLMGLHKLWNIKGIEEVYVYRECVQWELVYFDTFLRNLIKSSGLYEDEVRSSSVFTNLLGNSMI